MVVTRRATSAAFDRYLVRWPKWWGLGENPERLIRANEGKEFDNGRNLHIPWLLKGFSVPDQTQFEAGTTCTEALAWMGADIAKVEPPRGEAGRTGFGDAFYFMMYNANKRSLTVNLKDERGLALVKEMVKKADVFTENFAPGAVERLGLRYDVVSGINPSIIYARVECLATQPDREGAVVRPDRAGCRRCADITGESGGRPVKPGPTIGDTGTGMLMAFSIVRALFIAPAAARDTGCRWRCRIW